MQIKVKPVLIVGRGWHVFPQPDGQLEVTTDMETSRSKVESLHRGVSERLTADVAFSEPALVLEEDDLAKLRIDACDADALLVYISGGMPHGPFERLVLDLDIPTIAFSGERTPMMGLYALPAEVRERYPNVTFALDHREIDEQVRLLGVRKKLRNTKVVLLGRHERQTSPWQHIPDPDIVRRNLGVEFIPVSSSQFLKGVSDVEDSKAEALAQQWMANAEAVAEPSPMEVKEAAKTYLALDNLLKTMHAQAVSVNCLELMYQYHRDPPCFVLAMLRDDGFPAGCEADASATLTMVILEYVADRPAYMGNVVRADPENNLVMISHGCSPSRIAGRNLPSKPYKLVHSHSCIPFTRTLDGGAGVTSYVDYLDKGQEVTIARIGVNLDRMLAVRGEIVDCRDTICDRTTLTLRVNDAREFFHKATGNHQVVVYGNYTRDLSRLCEMLSMRLVTL